MPAVGRVPAPVVRQVRHHLAEAIRVDRPARRCRRRRGRGRARTARPPGQKPSTAAATVRRRPPAVPGRAGTGGRRGRARSRSATSRSSRCDSDRMIPAARPAVRPSAIASAYPRIDVSGVRRSCDTDSRNCCSSPRDRSRPPAIVLMEQVVGLSSSRAPSRSGASRVLRSPAAIRCVADSAARRRPVRKRLSNAGDDSAGDQGEGGREHEPPERPPRCQVHRTGQHGDQRALADRLAGARAYTVRPSWPLRVSPASSRSRSKWSAPMPWG